MKKKSAIIFGISGQDGAYLANFLLKKNYKIIGTTRNKNFKNLQRLTRLKIINKIKIYEGEASNRKFCKKLLIKKVNEIYYLAGESSVMNSFRFPHVSFNSNVFGLLNILEIIKIKKLKTKVFNSGSAQFYGSNKNHKYNLKSKIEPRSIYGISKAASYWLIKIYREKYKIDCCTAVLFNHESILRPKEVVTKKIILASKKMKINKRIKLRLGDVNIYRDWGWAPEYVEAFWRMLQKKKISDFIIGTGKINSIKNFVDEVFKLQKISKKNVIMNSKELRRNLDIRAYKADISETTKKLGWKPKITFKKIVFKMVNNELF